MKRPTTIVRELAADAWGDTDFRFDRRAQRYRIASGAGKGQFIGKAAYLSSVKAGIVARSQDLVSLADDLADGQIDLAKFQTQAADLIKKIHVGQTILAADGHENVTAEDWLTVGRELKRQFLGGVDPRTDDRFGLKYLIQDIQTGTVSRARLKQRLRLYAQSGKKTYWGVRRSKSGDRFGYRVLGAAEHCPECLAYAAEPPKPVESLVLPTERCRCMNQCKCSIRFFKTLEGAIAAKAG